MDENLPADIEMARPKQTPTGDKPRGNVANLKPFKPGQSGNPSGRPKGIARAVRERFGEDPTSIVEFLIGVYQGTEDGFRGADRIKAAELALAYGWGKPAATQAPEGYDPLEVDAITKEARAIVEQLREGKAA